jgi:hypothetical protein
VSTIKQLTSQIKDSPGLMKNVLSLMKAKGEKLQPIEKVCVLTFDEMKISSKIAYDAKADQVLGPFQDAQVKILTFD